MTTATQTLFLSRIIMDDRSRHAYHLLGNPGKLYATLLQAFGTETGHHHGGDKKKNEDRDTRSLLFRIEPELRNALRTILVQSTVEPDWSLLDRPWEQWAAGEPETKSFDPSAVSVGRMCVFRLHANPTRSCKIPGVAERHRGRPKPLYLREEQEAWLRLKLENACEVLDLRSTSHGSSPYSRPGKPDQPQLNSVLFDGVARVRDGATLEHLLRNGIGRGRAFGFGLLSLKPL